MPDFLPCVSIQTTDFDPGAEYQALRASAAGNAGAVVMFSGLVREIAHGQSLNGLFLEHYPGMTERAIADIIAEAASRWTVLGARVIHRVGELRPADQIVLVAVASPHRGDAFAACEFIMDYLKTRAPLWKKELSPEGGHWVEFKTSDLERASRWSR